MAVTYQSSATSAPSGDSTSLTITAPSGIAEGDLLVASINAQGGSATSTGWTEIDQAGRLTTLYKVAVSADESATDYTFSFSNGSRSGGIVRISGQHTSPISTSSINEWGAGTSATTGTITPAPNSLLLFVVSNDDDKTISGYTITTSDPSWTEAFDVQGASSNSSIALAYATRPEATATGTGTATASASTSGEASLIAVAIPPNVTVSPSVLTATASIVAPAITGTANVSPAVITATASIQAPTIDTSASKWSNTSKSDTSPTISNESKS